MPNAVNISKESNMRKRRQNEREIKRIVVIL